MLVNMRLQGKHHPDVVSMLQSNQLFSDVPEDQLKQMSFTIRHGIRGQTMSTSVIAENERRIFFLLKGRAKIKKTTDHADEKTKALLFTNDVVVGTVSSEIDEYILIDSREATLASAPASEILKLAQTNRAMLDRYFNLLTDKINQLDSRYSIMAGAGVKHRLLTLFKEIAERVEVTREDGIIHFDNFLTHSEMADLLFTSRQSIISGLDAIEKNGLAIYTRKRITLLDGPIAHNSTKNSCDVR